MRNFLLFISFLTAFSLDAQDCSDLFISEYAEGPHNNNAIEIYNPTTAPINLSGYTINRYSNGASTVANTHVFSLSGLLGAGEVVVIGNGQLDSVWVPSGSYWSLPVESGFYSLLSDYCNGDYDVNSTFYFNGDDAITLEYNGNTVDIFGKVGEDPGLAWTSDTTAGFTDINGGDWWSKRHTLIRKSNIKKGVTVNPILFNPVVEYNLLPDSTFTELGTHICDCSSATNLEEAENISYVMYPNPVKKGNNISLSAAQPIKQIRIINMVGQKFLFNNIIDISDFSIGTYIIEIEFSNGIVELNKLVIE